MVLRASRLWTLVVVTCTIAITALTFAEVARAATWYGPYYCAIDASGGHKFCAGAGDQWDRIQMKATNGSLAVPYNWIQTNANNGNLVWSSGEINNYNWSLVNNFLYGTGVLNRMLVDNRYPGSVTGQYVHYLRSPF